MMTEGEANVETVLLVNLLGDLARRLPYLAAEGDDLADLVAETAEELLYDDPDVATLAGRLEKCAALVRSARLLHDAAARNLAAALHGGAIRLGPVVYSESRPLQRLLALDEDRAWDLLGQLVGAAGDRAWRELFPLTALRIGGVRAVAARAGWDPEAVEDTMWDTSRGEPKLTAKPAGKAPQYMQDAADGEVVRRPNRKGGHDG